MTIDFEAALAAQRPALLRHCYRLMGSYAEAEDLAQDALERAWQARESYRAEAPFERWLYTIATNACLNALARRKRVLFLPQHRDEPARELDFTKLEPAGFVTPAADAHLFPDPAEAAEGREAVALAFVALLQRVPPRQRAALLLKDVLGWSAEEIGAALGLSLASVSSALHRAREAVAGGQRRSEEPRPHTAAAFIRAWEARDLAGLVALLREDVELAMPPYQMWLRGVADVSRLFQTERFAAFWAGALRVIPTRANGSPAYVFYRDGQLHSIMVVRFVDERVAEMTVFIGPPYFAGFDLSATLVRTVSGSSTVMKGEGGSP